MSTKFIPFLKSERGKESEREKKREKGKKY